MSTQRSEPSSTRWGPGAGEGSGAASPYFSAVEMERRRTELARELESVGINEVLLYGAERSGPAVQWLTQWPVTREAAALWTPGGTDGLLFVQFANHVDNAQRLADGFEVRWGGSSTVRSVAEELRTRHAGGTRLAVIGPLPASGAAALQQAGADLVFCDRLFQRLRLVKSAEELAWVRRGVEFTDAGVAAMAQGACIGTSEAELGALVESAYLASGATNHIHYFATTAMDAPGQRVPAQWPSARRLAAGDVVTCEVSAGWWGYPGQLLRTFTVDGEPTPLYRALHDVATATFESVSSRLVPGATGGDLAAAASLIEEAGFVTCDDIVHGYVGGYLPPVVPGSGRAGTDAAFVVDEGMLVVVQPNVTTLDGTAGVQTGELLLVTASGPERLHRFPPGMGRIRGS